MGTAAPQPSRIRVHAPADHMSAKATARLVLRHFADHHPKVTLICDRDDGVLTLRALEVVIDTTVLRSADFGVCEVSSMKASQAQRVIPYGGQQPRRYAAAAQD